ncbi:MAG: hypothetical protein LBI66_09370 [Burkholderiaceae bacterium]|jgi:hypothetical protein|nr:hypothetical protein [Burkholderiaceae bacterium]
MGQGKRGQEGDEQRAGQPEEEGQALNLSMASIGLILLALVLALLVRLVRGS